ncbi:hypothetical protein [Actinoplanes sp. NPDC023714]|uniref:hypothetical protein n=1 Tax=Actinoplanes sp. NPDC023714 TaxID=3154322 RepID=UPI0033D59BA2
MTDDGSTRLETLRSWWRLPDETRKEVRSLAKSGRRHPDTEVAWVAWRWAEAVLPVGAPEPGRFRNLMSAAGFWIQIVAELASHSDPIDPPQPSWLDRRRARRILRLGPPL